MSAAGKRLDDICAQTASVRQQFIAESRKIDAYKAGVITRAEAVAYAKVVQKNANNFSGGRISKTARENLKKALGVDADFIEPELTAGAADAKRLFTLHWGKA